MNAKEAQALKAALKRWNVPGVVAPEDPGNPDGAWRVFDGPDPETRRDITADALAAVAKFEGPGVAATRRTGPTRGFVIPSGS
jgi:hypothetical protein